jgi:sugar phosphate isomerase/epimerase
MELTCTSFSFPLLSFEDSARVIALMGIPKLDVGAHQGGPHIQPAEVEESPRAVAERIRRAVGEAGLGVSDFFATFGDGFRDRPVNSLNPAEREANLRRFRAIVQVSKSIGAKGITILPGVVWDELGPEESFEIAVRQLRQLLPVAHDAGLRLSVEAHLESVVEPPDRALALMEAVPGLQLTLDYSHFIANGYQPEDVHPLVKHAGHFHARQARRGFLQTGHRDGTLDFADIVPRLHAAGYKGDVCIEYTWQEWRGANNVDVLMESILLRDLLRPLL